MMPGARRALVTGAGSGMTAGIAVAIAQDGFERIAFTYRASDPGATRTAIRLAGASPIAVRLDFAGDARDVAAALQRLVEDEGPFDTVIHGVGELTVKRFANLTLEDQVRALDVNLRSGLLVAHALLPHMREQRFGRVVFFGGNGSSETRPFRGFAAHQAAKSGLVAFARTLAVEEARHGITVNVIEPGDIRDKTQTREHARTQESPIPRGRPGSYEDVADVVRFLIAPERDFVTGAVIGVTGGLTEADERNAQHA
jgi:3-oxoacyl-[acyl-carrier protein] reductase